MSIVLLAIGAYFILMIAIGLMASRKSNHEGFVIGNRNVGFIPTVGSLAAGFRDGSGIAFWVGFGAVAGYAGIWVMVGIFAGLLLYSIFGYKMRKIAKENDYITVGEMIRQKLGSITERISSLCVLFFVLMGIAIQLYVSGHLFATVLGVDAFWGIFSVASVVGIYLFFGGYDTVVKTDAIQFFIILSLIAIPLFFPPKAEYVLDFGTAVSSSSLDNFTFFFIGFCFVLSTSETWQRVFSAKNRKVIKYGFPAAGLFLIIMTLSLIFLGMAVKDFVPADVAMDQIVYEIFKGNFMSVPLMAFIAVVFMAITMSTLDTSCYLTASTLAKNFLPPKITENRDAYIKFSKIVMILILVCMSVLALTISDVIQFLFSAAGMLFILTPVYVFLGFGFYKKSRLMDALISISLVISIVVYIYLFVNGAFEQMPMMLVPAICSTVLCVISIGIVRILGGKALR